MIFAADLLERRRAQREALEPERGRTDEPSAAALPGWTALVEKLRAFYHPKQRGFFTSPEKLKATKKTRRSGATAGGCRELIARSLEHPKHRATYIASTRDEASSRAWRNDTSSGFVDLIEAEGTLLEGRGRRKMPTYDLGGITVIVNTHKLVLTFSNGSLINLFGADKERDLRKLRGLAKDVFWVDEAQDFSFLTSFYKGVIVSACVDKGGECWLTGTPSKHLAGMFYDVTRDDGDPLPGWEIHRIAQTDNPFFGAVVWEGGQWFVVDNFGVQTGPYADEAEAEAEAIAIRWERAAGEAIRKNGWAADDSDVLRELKAIWVKEGASWVYAVHGVPEHILTYAPARIDVDGFPDIRRALADLPGRADDRAYFTALGADLGTRAAFAFVLWAWSLKDPVLYEVASWKKPGLNYDQMAAYLHAVRGVVNIGLITADAGGGGKPAVMGWSEKWVDKYQLPITEATKHNKRIAQNMLNTDIRTGNARFRKGGVLLAEMQAHRWKAIRSEDGKELEDVTPHDACDGGLYGHRESYHHRFRPETPPIVPGSPEWVTREEQELERDICEQDDRGAYDGYGAFR